MSRETVDDKGKRPPMLEVELREGAVSKLTDVNLSILADTDCPSDWEREDLLEFAQEAAREILALRAQRSREHWEAKDQDR